MPLIQRLFRALAIRKSVVQLTELIDNLGIVVPLDEWGREGDGLHMACPWNNYKFLQIVLRPRGSVPGASKIGCLNVLSTN